MVVPHPHNILITALPGETMVSSVRMRMSFLILERGRIPKKELLYTVYIRLVKLRWDPDPTC